MGAEECHEECPHDFDGEKGEDFVEPKVMYEVPECGGFVNIECASVK